MSRFGVVILSLVALDLLVLDGRNTLAGVHLFRLLVRSLGWF